HRRPAVRQQHSRRGGEARYNRRQRMQTGTCQAGTVPGLAARLSGFVVSLALLSPAIAAAQEWPTYGGDPGGRRFSNATQITPDNVARPMPAWTFHTAERPRPGPPGMSFENTPILADGRLLVCTPSDRVIALDPLTGRQEWAFDPKLPADLK